MITLSEAIALAARAHQNQVDLAGEPYILHPIRIMNNVKTDKSAFYTKMTETCRYIAVLHYVLEDHPEFDDELRKMGIGIYSTLKTLTKKKDQTYQEYIEEVVKCPVASYVKILDLEDNMDLSRIKSRDLTKQDIKRFNKYRAAWIRLQEQNIMFWCGRYCNVFDSVI